ncbi:MAG: multicopper oxidase domain-containing protein, partial [Gemmatimonadales bacterium]
MSIARRLSAATLILISGCTGTSIGRAPLRIVTHDNTAPAGTRTGDTLRVRLAVQQGAWFPESEQDTSAVVWAFAEAERAPMIPGPLLRIPTGTVVRVMAHNTNTQDTLRLHGLFTRPGIEGTSVRIAPGDSAAITFDAGAPGTYFYWGSYDDEPLDGRPGATTMLSGALVIDPVGGSPPDRIYVMGTWHLPVDSTLGEPFVEPFMTVINGRSFPSVSALNVTQGDTVRWRWINPSSDAHPIHLHGFFFNVTHRGTWEADTAVTPQHVVTEMRIPGGTFAGEWIATEPGNWVAHCHFAFHTSQFVSLKRIPDPADPGGPDSDHSYHGMRGMVVPVTVTANPAMSRREEPDTGKMIRIDVRQSGHYGKFEGLAYALGGTAAKSDTALMYSPTLVLHREQPVRLNVVNHLRVPTAVHWHGLEIPSYPDGVPGWSGIDSRLAKAIAPGDSFTAAYTPPRSGTFIYHAHSNETFQISSGLYGALLVVDPDTYHPELERVVVIGGDGTDFEHGRVNGSRTPDPLTISVGRWYRFRIVHINPDRRIWTTLVDGDSPLQWTVIAKDGYDIAPADRVRTQARWLAGPGETVDVAVRHDKPGDLVLRVKTAV